MISYAICSHRLCALWGRPITSKSLGLCLNIFGKDKPLHVGGMLVDRTAGKAVDQHHYRTCSTLHNLRSSSICVRSYVTAFAVFFVHSAIASMLCVPAQIFSWFKMTFVSYSSICPYRGLECFGFLHSSAIRHSGTALASGALRFSGGKSAEKAVADADRNYQDHHPAPCLHLHPQQSLALCCWIPRRRETLFVSKTIK